MRASILIGVHNEGERLWKTVESVLETMGKLDAEVLVSDDGSTDDSVSELKRHFPRIAVVEGGPRIGVGAARGLAADRARGNVLIFLDGHTKPEASALERLVSSVEKTNGEAVITPRIVGLDEASWKSLPQQIGHGYALDLETFDSWWLPLKKMREVKEARRTFFESPALVGCALAVSRELYDRLWGFDPHMRQWGNEDLDFALKAWTMGARVLHDPEATVAHRFQRDFADYEVNAEYPLANQIRSARKHFTQSVWEDWVTRAQQQPRLRLKGHPEGLWASAWEVFQRDRPSAEHERAYLLSHRVQDEFWFAKRFDRSWPIVGTGASVLTQTALPPNVLFAKAMSTPPPAPHIDSIEPDNGLQGQDLVGVQITGTNLSGCTVANVDGITINVGLVSATEIDAEFVIDPSATVGDRSIVAQNQYGSDQGTFTVNPAPPTVDSVDPESGEQGETLTVIVTGQNLLAANFGPVDGITISAVVAIATQLSGEFAIDQTATVGARTLTVTNPAGSDTGAFEVDPVTPQVDSIEPESGCQGNITNVTITGSGFVDATLQPPSGIIANITSQNWNSISASLTIAADAATGSVIITVANASGESDTANFAVNQTYTLTSVTEEYQPPNRSRTTIAIGEVVNLTFSGDSPTWSVSGGGTLSTSGSSGTLTASFNPGAVTVSASQNGCTTSITFNVIAPSIVMLRQSGNTEHCIGRPDIGMCCEVFIGPDSVNFDGLYFQESNVACTADGVFGCLNGTYHCGSTPCPVSVCSDTVVSGYGTQVGAGGYDHVYSGDCQTSAPFTPGTLMNEIPASYSNDPSIPFIQFYTQQQLCELASDGVTLTASKSSASATTTISSASSYSACSTSTCP